MAADRLQSANSDASAALPRRDFLGRALAALAAGALFGHAKRADAAPQGALPFLGVVGIFAGNFPPQGWAFCDGQLLPISEYNDLFNLIGTIYGGDGVTNFALPDLRGRAPIQPGQGPGLNLRSLGEVGGVEDHPLTTAQIPAHTHAAGASAANGSADGPAGLVPARTPAAIPQYGASADANLSAAAVGLSGGGEPHNNLQPFLAVSYIIATQGDFPPPP